MILRTVCIVAISLLVSLPLAADPASASWTLPTIGIVATAFALFAVDWCLRRYRLRGLLTFSFGLLLGYLTGQILVLVFALFQQVAPLSPSVNLTCQIGLMLVGLYGGVVGAFWAARQGHVELPFVHIKSSQMRSREILLDASVLSDPRLIDLSNTGLLDERLVLPRCVLSELQQSRDSLDEEIRQRAQRHLEVVRKLEALPRLSLRREEKDFPNLQDGKKRLIELALSLRADILVTDRTRIGEGLPEDVRVVTMEALSKAMRPLKQTGEFLDLRIQRYGKEPLQGVGYLEDGTMVVVNGGGDFIGQEVRTRVLSVKHSAAGRMVFCNVAEENALPDHAAAHRD